MGVDTLAYLPNVNIDKFFEFCKLTMGATKGFVGKAWKDSRLESWFIQADFIKDNRDLSVMESHVHVKRDAKLLDREGNPYGMGRNNESLIKRKNGLPRQY